MENVETKKKIIGLPSTIVAGIFLSFALIFAILLLTMNLQAALKELAEATQESVNNNENQAGAAIGMSFAVMFGALVLFIVYYGVVIIPFVIVNIMLIFVIKNLKHADVKAIRIINFVYLGLIIAINVICIIKFVLFITNVG